MNTRIRDSKINAAMHAAARKGFDPYNSFDAFAKQYRCIWLLNFCR